MNTTKLLLISTAPHSPLSLRPLSAQRARQAQARGRGDSRDLAPSSVSYGQGCSAVFTSRTKRDGQLFTPWEIINSEGAALSSFLDSHSSLHPSCQGARCSFFIFCPFCLPHFLLFFLAFPTI